jgi:hypothetical protein
MLKREELRALKRVIKMSREGKVKRKVCIWKINKEKNISKEKYVYERMKEEEEKKKRGVARKI